MARNYYYLTAGLPELALDIGKTPIVFAKAVEELSEQVAAADAALFDCLRLPFDNYNIVSMLHGLRRPFDRRGKFARHQLQQELKNPEQLPEYAVLYAESVRTGGESQAAMGPDDQLATQFFIAMQSHPNDFIRQWFDFDVTLRNILAAVAHRGHPGLISRSLAQVVLPVNDAAETILQSTAPDFSLGQQLPWLERVMSFGSLNMTEREKALDALRWEMLDELTTFSYFQIETLLAFVLKLLIVQRWMGLNAAEGQARLDLLLKELTQGVSLDKTL
jgi:hypothetical protein